MSYKYIIKYEMKNKALIVDDNSDFVVSLYKYMQSQIPELDIIGLASNGEEAIKYIYEINPDIVFLDLDMPKVSGIEVLEKIRSKNVQVIIMSGKTQLINDIALVDFRNIEKIYIKPFELGELKTHLKDLIYIDTAHSIKNLMIENEAIELKLLIKEDLSQFNFNTGSKGYIYLTKCIIEIFKDPRKLDNIEKLLFPSIAYQLNIDNPKVIKWSIQKLISSMIRYTNSNVILEYFPHGNKPTIKMFLSTITNSIRTKYS